MNKKNEEVAKVWCSRFINGESREEINADLNIDGASFDEVCGDDTFPAFFDDVAYTWKPKTFQINGIDVPTPMSEALRHGEKYFIRLSDIKPGYSMVTWCNSAQDYNRINNSQIWATEDEIKQVIAADRSVNAKG